jgi:uncharacterized membrane-anchored protein
MVNKPLCGGLKGRIGEGMMGMLQGVRSRFAAVAAACASALFAGMVLMGGPAYADGTEPPMSVEEMLKAKGVTQVIPLGDGAANLELRKGYAFIPASDVPPILQQLGVAPPSGTILGAVTAEGAKPTAKGYWISVVSQDQIGHVPESGADEISSVSFLDSVKAARTGEPKLTAFNPDPVYAAGAKALSWGEVLDTGAAANLRNEQRLLGRDFVIGVTTYGASSAAKKIAVSGQAVAGMCVIAPGHLYSDFVPATDRLSEYDLPGLITGKRRAGPLAETADAGGAPAPATASALSLADFMPGGKMGWAPFALAGVVGLGIIYLAISAVRRGPSGGRNADEPPADDNPNAV